MTSKVTLKDNLSVIYDPHLGYRHLDPLPDPLATARYYGVDDAFYRGGAKWLRKEQQEHLKGLWRPAYRWQATQLFEVARCHRLVDLGAGAGWFVKFWGDEVGPAVGVEPSRGVLEYSPCPGRIETNLALASKRFRQGAAVYLRASLLLEHLPDPVGYLREALGYFPGTQAVMIIVPSEFNPLQLKLNKRLKPDKRFWWVAKDHLNYFEPGSLRNIMAAAGLRIVWQGATCPIELFALMGLNYIGNDQLGRFVHRTRLNFERVLGDRAFELYRWLYRRYVWGRELIFIGVPND